MKSTEMRPMQRIVTGHDEHGTAIVSMQGEPPNCVALPTIPGTFFFEIWKTSQTPALVGNDGDPTPGRLQLAPHPNGCTVRIVQIAPERDVKMPSTPEEMAAHFREAGAAQATTGSAASPHPLMHRTETLDFGILIDGELTLVLDDSEVVLHPGDVVVQRGTNHSWSNRGDLPCRIAFILLDGVYASDVRGALEARAGKH